MKNKILAALLAQPHAEPLTDSAQIKSTYHHWRVRQMYSMMIGYALFYFVRKNFSMAMPVFLSDLGYTKTDLGWILTVFSVIYGFAKFGNGILADRANPRYFMAVGLILSAIVNIIFGLSSGLTAFGICWLLNGWFQGMGWPPCARSLVHWYGPTERGTAWGIWNASHQVGGAGILILAGYLVEHYSWRSAFIIPAILAIGVAFFLINRLRDTPQSLGLPPIEVFHGELRKVDEHEDSADSFKEILWDHVLKNRLVWIVSFANFFVYIVRIGVLDWAPTFLVEVKGSSVTMAGFKVAAFEVAGIVGAISAGLISDRIFKGKRGPVNVLCMALLIFFMVALWMIPAGYPWLDAVALFAVGFVVYGPQMLVSVAAADFASKKAAATATGMTGTFGYLGSALCGVGTGMIVDHWGWDGGFLFFIASAAIGV
ncbi:MAG: MFS transporter, partial [Deltaproteobacteria bacterium]|nr:MFS transporter [Deltaproteobacteria bacterium]